VAIKIPNGEKCLSQDLPKYTNIGIFGMKIYHLETLVR
jgi:hypothetical protein